MTKSKDNWKRKSRFRQSMVHGQVNWAGTLSKKSIKKSKFSNLLGKWHERWFEISGNYLRYYLNDPNTEESEQSDPILPITCLDLRFFNQSRVGRRTIALKSIVSEDGILLQASNKETIELWESYIQTASSYSSAVHGTVHLGDERAAEIEASSKDASSDEVETVENVKENSSGVKESEVPTKPLFPKSTSFRRSISGLLSKVVNRKSSVTVKYLDTTTDRIKSVEKDNTTHTPALDRKFIGDSLDSLSIPNTLFVASFNILADTFVCNPRLKNIYNHCEAECLPWEYRFPLILEHLISLRADVLCLQEVEKQVFDEEIMPVMKQIGYDGVIQVRKKADNKGIPSCATLYLRNAFDLVWDEHKFRGLVVGLRPKYVTPETVVAVGNVHLEGAPWKHAEREAQLKSVEKSFVNQKSNVRIICGDFNTGANSALYQNMIKEYYESAYSSETGDATCMLMPHNLDNFDVHGARVDHIFYSKSHMRILGIIRSFESTWDRHRMIQGGLPSLQWPSDHVSVGAIFKLENLEGANETIGKTALYEHVETKVPLTENVDIETVDLKEIFEQIPFNEEEKLNWLSIQNSTPAAIQNPGSKTKEEITEIRAWSSQRKEFINALDAQTKKAVSNYLQLEKKFAKMKKG